MRRLSAEEAALWRRVVESVQPYPGKAAPPAAPTEGQKEGQSPGDSPLKTVPALGPKPVAAARPRPGTTLDGTWDRRLSRGLVQPDATVDLHGHNLDTAWTLLDRRLDQSIALGDRLFLLITGKAPTDGAGKRGAIRAAVDDWLAVSRHARSIAAVRNAHPRHGGAGALYVVLRKPRARP
jgi:DNA-nicking Smr family endonuclease